MFHLQRIQGEGDPDDIDDGIDGSHLVKMDSIEGKIMDLAFRNANLFEYSETKCPGPVAETGLFNHPHNIRVMSVMLRQGLRIKDDVHLKCGNSAFVHSFPF